MGDAGASLKKEEEKLLRYFLKAFSFNEVFNFFNVDFYTVKNLFVKKNPPLPEF